MLSTSRDFDFILGPSNAKRPIENLCDVGRIASHPLKTAEGEAPAFRITSRKVKSEVGPDRPKGQNV